MKTKVCRKCFKRKLIIRFQKDKRARDGYVSPCTACNNERNRKWSHTQRGRESKRNALKKYRHTQWGRKKTSEWRKEWFKTKKGKAFKKRLHQRYKALNPEKFRARAVINKAIVKKRIPAPSSLSCKKCHNQAEHYHHHMGYSKQYWLDVIPLCRPCHRRAHFIV